MSLQGTTSLTSAGAEPVEQRVFALWRELRWGAPRRAARAVYDSGGQRLERSQVDVLDYVFDHDAVPMGDLAFGLGVEASTATRSVERLVRRGLLVRRADEDDARVVRVELTAEGRATCETYMSSRARFLEIVFADFSPQEMEDGARFLERLIAGTERAIDEAVASPARGDRQRDRRST